VDALINWLVAEDYLQTENPLDGTYLLTERGQTMVG